MIIEKQVKVKYSRPESSLFIGKNPAKISHFLPRVWDASAFRPHPGTEISNAWTLAVVEYEEKGKGIFIPMKVMFTNGGVIVNVRS